MDKFLLTDEQTLNLARTLEHKFCKIETLEIELNTLGSKHLKEFCEGLKKNKSLTRLVFNQLEVIGHDLDIVFCSLKSNCKITEIQFDNIKMLNSSCQHLRDFIQNSPNLEILKIANS